ncbi:MAG: hypothetical protein UZ07_CHB004000245 [Chlorobi bacterium OLB7]|nr:MAG: hypothetical protein UZ07_CHB004000245 [Chlorobi bacterium OLB7]
MNHFAMPKVIGYFILMLMRPSMPFVLGIGEGNPRRAFGGLGAETEQ